MPKSTLTTFIYSPDLIKRLFILSQQFEIHDNRLVIADLGMGQKSIEELFKRFPPFVYKAQIFVADVFLTGKFGQMMLVF